VKKTICANPYCQKEINRDAALVAGKNPVEFFCDLKCYAHKLSYEVIAAHEKGLKKAERRLKLGALLLKNKLLSAEKLQIILEQQKGSLKKLGEIAVENGFITEKDLLKLLALQAGVAPVNLDPKISLKLTEILPEELFRKLEFVVFGFNPDEKELSVAVADCEDIPYLFDLFSTLFSGYVLKFFLEEREKVLTILDAHFGRNRFQKKEAATTGDQKIVSRMQQDAISFIAFLQTLKAEDVRINSERNRLQIQGQISGYRFRIYLEAE